MQDILYSNVYRRLTFIEHDVSTKAEVACILCICYKKEQLPVGGVRRVWQIR